jgi:hypothetical protein
VPMVEKMVIGRSEPLEALFRLTDSIKEVHRREGIEGQSRPSFLLTAT